MGGINGNVNESTSRTHNPDDWPTDTINLAVHDLPHSSSMVEWWYLNAHLSTKDGRKFAVFGSFFRGVISKDKKVHGHALTWALTDIDQKRYLTSCRFEDSMRLYALDHLHKNEEYNDIRIHRAVEEMLVKGDMPKPDRIFESPVSCSTTNLDCKFGESSLKKEGDGSYSLILSDNARLCKLHFQPQKAPVRHGNNGITRGLWGDPMFYYFISQNKVLGTILLDGEEFEVTGYGWYDHQFGESNNLTLGTKIAWNWCGVQLDGGSELTISMISKGGKEEATAILLYSDGQILHSDQVSFVPRRFWRSIRTFEEYPVAWDIQIPALGVDLSLESILDDQEFVTALSRPAFWEGQLRAKGTVKGKPVQGFAYVEHTGFATTQTLDDLFSNVSKEVRSIIDFIFPLRPESKHAASIFTDVTRSQLLEGVDLTLLSDNLIKPVREITDRGGKAWRSYATLACCEAVGGDSRKFYKWLAIPELIHTGALIIDDLEDSSEKRRGGPTVHKLYGVNIAINAGTNAYFAPQEIIRSSNVSDSDKLRLYDLYFEALREAHAGQALDIAGFKSLPDQLERSVLAIYRLKTSAPVACLARMGAIIGGGSEAQIEALGNYFEKIGTAFQIVDDVLNLRGFEGNLKTLGEDISGGKITLPVAKALVSLNQNDGSELLKIVRSKSTDPKEIAHATKLMESCGALDICMKEAYSMVESAWKELDPILEPTISKIMLRGLGWYVLERHY